MKFICFKNHIEIEPIDKGGVLQTEDKRFLEMGKVLSVSEGETFFKVGDIACFESMAHTRIPAHEGEPERHVVQIHERSINGKYEK